MKKTGTFSVLRSISVVLKIEAPLSIICCYLHCYFVVNRHTYMQGIHTYNDTGCWFLLGYKLILQIEQKQFKDNKNKQDSLLSFYNTRVCKDI